MEAYYGLILILITVPVIILLIQFDNSFQLFKDYTSFMKGFFYGILIVLMDGIIYYLITKIKLFK